MSVPFIDLVPAIEATAAQSKANLDRMFECMQFISGEQLNLFEREFAASMGSAFAVGVGSGTAAIELCLRAAGLAGSGREVITSALTSPFTAQAILAAGCVPRFADVDPDSLLLNAADVERRATRRTGALIPVHLYGQPCDLRRFASLARRIGAVVVQDACQAHGTRFRERPLTDFSPYVAYSFYPTKNLGALGDGGAIATNRRAISNRLRLLRDGGRKNDQVSRIPAINSRLDEMQCCYLRAFLPHLDDWSVRRARLANRYDELLRPCYGVRPLARGSGSVNHLYVIRVPKRDRLRDHLARYNVMTAIHYPIPLHLQPAFRSRDLGRGDLPQAEKVCREIVSLPLWPYMPDVFIMEVAARILEFYQNV